MSRVHWLLLRGLGRERAHWHDFPQALERSLVGARAHPLDLPGAGTERERRPPCSLAGVARDIAERVEHLVDSSAVAPHEPWAVLGLSLGGMIALELCREHPSRFHAAVVLNASSALSPPLERFQPAAARVLAAALWREPLAREEAILRLTSRLDPVRRRHYAERAAAVAVQRPARPLAIALQLLAASRFHPSQSPPRPVPLLFLSSARDDLVSPRCTDALARHHRAPHLQHPWAGHDLPLDDPDWVCAQLRLWSEAILLH